MTPEMQMAMVTDRLLLVEQELDVLIRWQQVQAEARGLTSKERDLVDQFESILERRHSLMAKPFEDDDTDPGRRP